MPVSIDIKLCHSDISYGEGNPHSIICKFVLNIDHLKKNSKISNNSHVCSQIYGVLRGFSHVVGQSLITKL